MKKSVWIFVVVMLLSLCMAAFSACSVGGDSGNTKPDSSANSESYRENNISGDDKESESVSQTQTGSESDKTSESESGETSESESMSESESESKSESGEESVHTHKFERNADERYLKSSATCEKRAEYYFSCKCGEMGMQTFEYGDLLPHTEAIDTEIKATCISAGLSAGKHCSVCNKVLEAQIAIPALGHDLAMHEGKASTCTEKGYAAYETCRRCDYMTYRELPLAEHELENGICKNCGREITPHTHIEVIDEGKPATCLESGLTDGKHCSVCNKILEEQQVIPALGHDTISHDGKAATCTEAGYEAYETCSRCDYTTYEVIPALGHNLNTHYNGKAATCTEAGYEDYETCSRCDYSTYTEIPALGHAWKEIIMLEDGRAICESSYFVGNKCTRCNFLDESSVVAREPAEHIVANDGWMLDRTPTLTETGCITGICETCNKTVAMEIPAVNSEDYNIDRDIDTCNENGFEAEASLKAHNCIKFTVKVPAKKHKINLSDGVEHEVSPSNVITITEEDVSSGCIQLFGNTIPTCDDQGIFAATYCEVCGAKLAITIRFNHTPFTEEGIQAAAESHYTSCVDIGHSGEFRCKYCSENVRLELPELGHEYEYKIEANHVVAGEKQTFRVTRSCKRNSDSGYEYDCDYYEFVANDAEGELIDSKTPNCIEEGYYMYNFYISGGIITARVNIPKAQHYVLDGEEQIYIEDGLVNYDKFIEQHGERLIFLFGNVKPTCTTLAYGYYVCAQCGKSILVSLVGSHKKPKDTTKITCVEATCNTPEMISYICQYEDHNEEVIEEVGAPLGHLLDFTYDEESKVIVASCVRKYECGREDTTMKVTDIKIKAPDCRTPKEITYIGEDGCRVVCRVGNPVHSLSNENGESYLAPEKDENGNDIIYTVDGERVFTFKNTPACSSADGVAGYYVCVVCGESILVKVRADHKKIDGTEMVIKPATCVEDGEMTYRCSTCDPDNNIIHVSIPALGHDLVYWSVIEGDTVIVKETCMREGCSLEEKRTTIGNINNSEIFVKDIELSKPATCTLDGIDVYKFDYVNICGGIVNLEVYVITQKLNHNEYYVETSWKKDGVIYYGYYCEKCDQYIITRTETEA